MSINLFSWYSFPLESDKFILSYCYTTVDEQVVSYIKCIFPETTFCDTIESYNKCNDKKKVLFLRCDEKLSWDRVNLISDILNEKVYVIAVGTIDTIPRCVMSLSDIVIFDDKDTANKYTLPLHISACDITNNFIICDNRTYETGWIDDKRLGTQLCLVNKNVFKIATGNS